VLLAASLRGERTFIGQLTTRIAWLTPYLSVHIAYRPIQLGRLTARINLSVTADVVHWSADGTYWSDHMHVVHWSADIVCIGRLTPRIKFGGLKVRTDWPTLTRFM
jgi:hypothetical protein